MKVGFFVVVVVGGLWIHDDVVKEEEGNPGWAVEWVIFGKVASGKEFCAKVVIEACCSWVDV